MAMVNRRGRFLIYILFIAAFFFLSASTSFALQLTNPTIAADNFVWVSTNDGDAYARWATEYYLTDKVFGPLDAFCVENATAILNGANYELVDVPGTDKFQLAAVVATNYYYNPDPTIDWSKSATQLAIWEILFDNSFNLTGGTFQVHDYNATVRGQAQAILDAINPINPQQLQLYTGDLSVAVSPYESAPGSGEVSQDYFVPITAPIPEPGTLLLMGIGIIGVAGIGRKKFLRKNK